MLRLQPTTLSLKTAELNEYEPLPCLSSWRNLHRRRLWLRHRGQPRSCTGTSHRTRVQTSTDAVPPKPDDISLPVSSAGIDARQLLRGTVGPSDDGLIGNASTTASRSQSDISFFSSSRETDQPAEAQYDPTLVRRLSYPEDDDGHNQTRATQPGERTQSLNMTWTTAPDSLPCVELGLESPARNRRMSLAESVPKALPPPFSTTPRAMMVGFWTTGLCRKQVRCLTCRTVRATTGNRATDGDHSSNQTCPPTTRLLVLAARDTALNRSVPNLAHIGPCIYTARIKSSAHRFISAVRSLSIHGRGGHTSSAGQSSIAPALTGDETSPRNMAAAGVAKPSLSIFDDSLPASTQPRTPAHLPESRHRSRVDGASTETVSLLSGTRPRVGSRHTTPVRRWTPGRGTSPQGMRTPGFEGLYGGSENTGEDAQ